MWQRLKLTEEEARWNSYRGENGLPPVMNRRYPYTATLRTNNQAASVPHFTSRRSRVWGITWTGDVSGVRVNIGTSTGERLTVTPCHVPLLCGTSPHSTYSRSPLIAAYPSTLLGAAGAASFGPGLWTLTLDPNFVLPGNVTLQFDYSLEDVTPSGDPYLIAGGAYTVYHVVHVWEFPGFQGGAK